MKINLVCIGCGQETCKCKNPGRFGANSGLYKKDKNR